jgi:sugar phosphate isomerase/epimerase
MQPAAMTYCLENALPDDERDAGDVLQFAAREGIECVEFYAGRWEVGGDRRRAAESVRGLADDAGVRIPAYGSGTRLGHLDHRRQQHLDELKIEVEACAILGGTVLAFPTVDAHPIPPDAPNATVGVHFERLLPDLVEQTQELADVAARHGVTIAVLNHCFVVDLSWRQRWLVELTDRENCGACVDPGNYLHYGHQDALEACNDIAGAAKMVRAGDVTRTPVADVKTAFGETGAFQPWGAASFGEGIIDQEACYRSLKDAGFDGVVSLKTAGASPDGPLAAVRQSWAALTALLRRVG